MIDNNKLCASYYPSKISLKVFCRHAFKNCIVWVIFSTYIRGEEDTGLGSKLPIFMGVYVDEKYIVIFLVKYFSQSPIHNNELTSFHHMLLSS